MFKPAPADGIRIQAWYSRIQAESGKEGSAPIGCVYVSSYSAGEGIPKRLQAAKWRSPSTVPLGSRVNLDTTFLEPLEKMQRSHDNAPECQ